MLDRNVWELVQLFNRHRNPIILPRKYANLRKNSFTFFRGTSHLFYHDLAATPIRHLAPFVWICGDLHLENFGTYKGDDRQIYFGINDFDEGALARSTWDLTRLVTSIFVAADSLEISPADAQILAKAYLASYATALKTGQIRSIVADNAHGIVENLLVNLQQRNRLNLLEERTELINECRHLKFDDQKILKINQQSYDRVKQTIDKWAQTRPDSDFFEILDIGFRVAGTGSLGLDRYLILVVGKGSPDRNYLLDFKQQPTSTLQAYLTKVQPQWSNQATRVMKIQQLVQSAPPALAAAIDMNGSSYFLRELQPTQDKITLKPGKFTCIQLERLIDIMAQVTASAHLHGSGKSGAAIADDLMAFGDNLNWQPEILTYGQKYAQQVQRDYQNFCKHSSQP